MPEVIKDKQPPPYVRFGDSLIVENDDGEFVMTEEMYRKVSDNHSPPAVGEEWALLLPDELRDGNIISALFVCKDYDKERRQWTLVFQEYIYDYRTSKPPSQ